MIAAVVPAAGLSLRMGRPKLLIDLGGQTLIHRVVSALREGGVDRVVVVAPVDSEGADEVADEAAEAGAEVLIPEVQPVEMRDSVELGLAVLDREPRPSGVLLTPGDVPGIGADLVERLIAIARAYPDRIVIPTRDGRRGHPIVLPWDLAVRVRYLPDDAGVDRLVEDHLGRHLTLSVDGSGSFDDLDTPEDLERWEAGR